jgi:hypothetical protein
MPDEKEKAIEKGHEIKPRAPQVEDELSETDVEKVAGGAVARPVASSMACR